MNYKRCFTGHALAHSLSGLGVGIILIQYVPSLNTLMVGVAALVIGIVWDMMSK
ncbi:MAG TPA: hypothetical protein VFA93_02870 [Patescibacteria group bacterium]|nr:hypothetical protein [Patescibacteria group bacterium]